MKIGHFTTEFPYKNPITGNIIKDYPYGGVENATYNLAIQAAKLGHKVNVFTSSIDKKDYTEDYDNIKIFRYGRIIKIESTLISMKLLYKPLNHDIDIVHGHLGNLPAAVAALMYSKKKKKPLVIHYHGDSVEDFGGFIRKLGVLVHNKYAHKILSCANVIISSSEHYINESRFLDRYRDKIVVIPYGINLSEFDIGYSKKECRDILKLSQDGKIILSIGTISHHKGSDVLVKAMPAIIKNTPNVKLIFVGTGVMVEELKALSEKLGIKKNIEFTGFIGNNAKKAMYYRSSDIFVLPSTGRHEISGIVNIEAMACGIPVVASKIGGVPDIVKDGENGILVQPKSPDALSNAIIHLLDREYLCEMMGRDGRKKAEDYSWERTAKEIENIYTDLLD
ncbi:MAG: glycosyltransferase family 4 protein [Candidatus Methanoperedens sp.]|nr:glycosyltransferase family 4 protein [Candidatus Methanoperedens sp.]